MCVLLLLWCCVVLVVVVIVVSVVVVVIDVLLLLMGWGDDVEKLEKVFENEVYMLCLILMLCVNLGLDCIRTFRIFALTLSSGNGNLEVCCVMCCVMCCVL